MLKKTLSFFIISLAIALGFFVTNSGNRAMAVSDNWSCAWQNDGRIDCHKPSGTVQLAVSVSGAVQEAGIVAVGGVGLAPITGWVGSKVAKWQENVAKNYDSVQCVVNFGDCDIFKYNPQASANNGYPVYCAFNDDGSVQTGAYHGCLHYVDFNPVLPWHANDATKINSQPKDPGNSDNDPNYWAVSKIENAGNKAPGSECGLSRPTNCDWDHNGKYNGAALDRNAIDKMTGNISAIQSLIALKQQCEDSAPIPFITCPIYNAVVEGISKLIGGQGVTGDRQGLLVDFLTIEPLTTKNGVNVFQQIVGNVVSLANMFYVVIFLILIFSSSLPFGLDNYTIKKTLPKFIAAVIMTQFAYVICGIIIDFFNLLGTIVPNMIFALESITKIGLPQGGGGGAINAGLTTAIVVGGAGAAAIISTVGWILLLILAFIAIIAILVAFVYMVLRYLILYILILLSPLAFASWVLPGTEKFFSNWWKNFIKLNAMFPMITGMLAVSILLSRVLVAGAVNTGDGTANGALILVGMIIPIVALLAIPKTLKWTTQGMSALAGGMLGAVAGKMGAGGRAVSNQAQKQAKKGVQYGQGKSVEFGKRRAAEMGIGTQSFQRRERQKAMEASRAKTKDEIINLDRDALRGSAANAALASGRNPRSTQSAGALKAHLDRLIETGDSVGLAQAMQSYHSAGVAAGLSSTEIDNNWSNALGSGYGAAKEMSPALVQASNSATMNMNSRAQSAVDVSNAGGHASGKEYVHMTEGDYSGMGEDKLAAMDTEMLKSIVTSVGNGAHMSDFKFDQQSVENVLTNPNSRFKSAEARQALRTIAATKGWRYQ